MLLSEDLICRLRELASRGASTGAMISEIRFGLADADAAVNWLVIELYFMRAFHLPLRIVRELEGSRYVEGLVHAYDEIDRIILPQIAENRHLWDSESHP